MRALDKRLVLQLVLVVVALAAVGAVCGMVWEWVWDPTPGVVVDHRWVPSDAIALQQEFSATGWYVAIASAGGLLAGLVVAFVADRVPLLTLAALVVGSALGAWLMVVVGSALGPADPTALARHAADGTKLAQDLDVTGASPWFAMPSGALLGLVVVFLGLSSRRHHHVAGSR